VQDKPVRLEAGETRVITFEIDCRRLKKGLHQVQVRVPAQDKLKFNDNRYGTFKVREGRKVLVIADRPADAQLLARVADGLPGFQCRVASTATVLADFGLKDLLTYRAVFLLSVAEPDPKLWDLLNDYVDQGGGLAIAPGGEELDKEDHL